MMKVFGPAVGELMSVLATQGAPSAPFSLTISR
jgi:hypothetical protein